MEAGGGQSKPAGGGFVDVRTPPATIQFDPDHWVLSVFRTLKGYVENAVDEDIYQIQFGFPGADDIGEWLPLEKALIHFEIDDITHLPVGFGDSRIDTQYDDNNLTITESEAQIHLVNWDIGVWTSAKSGGVTARLQTYQVLNDLFNGPTAFNNLRDLGIEIRNFSGGSFIKEEIDNISVFRVINITLVVRVVSRRLIGPTPYIQDIGVTPTVTVSGDDVIITDDV